MQWVAWHFDETRPTCDDCRDLHEDNGDVPPCQDCGKPTELSADNAQACNIWFLLDMHGRDIDTMAGNPLPLRLQEIDCECARYADTEGLRQRVLIIDNEVVRVRQETHRAKGK